MRMPFSRPLLSLAVALAAVALLACGQESTPTDDWSQWRGPTGLGLAQTGTLPTTWDASGEGIGWAAQISGVGTSSPIVSKNHVFLTSAVAADSGLALQALSLDVGTGAEAWRTTVVTRPREKLHPMNSPAGATPAADGRHVFVYFGTHLAALDYDGNLVWNNEIDPRYLEESRYGAGSSLFLVGDSIIVFRDRESSTEGSIGWIAAYAKGNGEQLWRKQWDNTCCSYTTPILRRTDTSAELLVLHAGKLVSYDPATGERLWRLTATINQPVAGPVIEGDLLCITSGAHGIREALCFDLSETSQGKPKNKPLWRDKRTVPATASPILLDGVLYMLHEKGILTAIEARTGQRVWQHRLPPGPYYASLVAGDGKLYATSVHSGVTVVALPSGEILAQNSLPDGRIIASPALTDGSLLVRAEKTLFRIDGAGTES